MLLIHYYALTAGAVLASAAWLYRPRERTVVSTLAAFLGWGLAALTGGRTETYATAPAALNTSTNTTVAVPQGEQLVAAPVPAEMRYLMALVALLSLLALILYVLGAYPPESTGPVDNRENNP